MLPTVYCLLSTCLMEAEAKLHVARKRWLRGWCLFFGVVIVAFLGFLAVRSYEEYRAEERIRAACAVADADDPNWRLADMLREYQKQPVANTLVEMFHAFPTAATGGWYLGWYGDDLLTRPGAMSYNDDFKPNIRLPETYLKILKERLQDSRLVKLREKMNAFGRAPLGQLPEIDEVTDRWVQETRYLLNYCADEVLLAVHEGRFDDGVPWIVYELELAEKMRQYPSLIHNLVAAVQLSITARDAQRIIMFGTTSPEKLAELQYSLSQRDRFEPARIVKLLRADLHHYLDLARRDPLELEKLRSQINRPAPKTKASFLDQVHFEWENINFLMAMSSLQIAEAEILELANQDIAEAKANPTKVMPLNFPSYLPVGSEKHHLVTQRTYDNTAMKVLSAHARCIAVLRSTIAAIACERYRLANGTWPATLEALVPTYLEAVLLDPYTGKPLLYKVLSDGAVVYSVGRNMIDDDGAVLAAGMTPKDFGVRLFDPKLRGLKYEVGYPSKESTNGPDK